MALDEERKELYVADSLLTKIWRVRIEDGHHEAETWLGNRKELAPNGFLGANGLKVHHGKVWVSNTSTGTLFRIPVNKDPDRSPGEIDPVVNGLTGIDDFDFTGPGENAPVLAAINLTSQLVFIDPKDGTSQPLLGDKDGLSNPTSVAVGNYKVYVASAAYETGAPNLLVADLDG